MKMAQKVNNQKKGCLKVKTMLKCPECGETWLRKLDRTSNPGTLYECKGCGEVFPEREAK